jgi:protein-disulfide isomerase
MSFTIDTVLARGQSSIRLVRRHFPLQNIHPKAHELARAGVCAEQQGEFDAYYRAAFEQQTTTLAPDWSGPLALMPPGIDSGRLHRCLEDPATAAIVEADIKAGSAIGLTATPSLLINGRLYRGSRSVAALDSLIAIAR